MLSKYGKKTFGDVHRMVATAYYELDSLQQHVDEVGYSNDLHERKLIGQKNLSTWLIFLGRIVVDNARVN